MNLKLFYDTETTGMIDFKAQSDAPHQPHIVQLAAALVDCDTRQVVSSIDVIVRPEGWVIAPDVAAIHGITTEKALDCGIDEHDAITLFMCMWVDKHKNARRPRVAHNDSFDARIMRIALMRHGFGDMILNAWEAAESFCTLEASKPIVNLPPTAKMLAAGFNRPKPPKLIEAYRHFFGKDFDGAHNAMSDVNACIAVYFAIQDLQEKAA